ncbi:hypothetical protein BD289DRAFT_79786 [Coniella lustricola]|uniref:Uncharacterized protein n=1 Tax=Coniella lustricola TaxID=2025994 RepID=A0A2T2ZZ48_9PEZI|nr:hypothetical protein BD289DRAFT_79786 [Coniella lustricola]
MLVESFVNMFRTFETFELVLPTCRVRLEYVSTGKNKQKKNKKKRAWACTASQRRCCRLQLSHTAYMFVYSHNHALAAFHPASCTLVSLFCWSSVGRRWGSWVSCCSNPWSLVLSSSYEAEAVNGRQKTREGRIQIHRAIIFPAGRDCHTKRRRSGLCIRGASILHGEDLTSTSCLRLGLQTVRERPEAKD